MWIYDRNPEWIGNYWCYLDDGSIEMMRVCSLGWWRCLDAGHWSDTKGRSILAWWEKPKPNTIPDIPKGTPPLHIDD